MTDAHSRILILTPVKDAVPHLERYFRLLGRLTYPAASLSLGLLDSDSIDGTFEELSGRLDGLRSRYRRVGLWKRDFDFRIPTNLPRWTPAFQIPRRTVLAKSRNHLLMHALDDEDWVLWIDVDLETYPADIIERLLSYEKDILQPHCVLEPGGRTFDLNAWAMGGRAYMSELRGQATVRLDSVGGTMLLVRADLHRDGLIFPPFLYGKANGAIRSEHPLFGKAAGEIETEGLAIMARDMGVQCWGLPDLEIVHR